MAQNDLLVDVLRRDLGFLKMTIADMSDADLLQRPVTRPAVIESTAMGAAYLAGLATGFWAHPQELKAKRRNDTRFEPKMSAEERAERRSLWNRAVGRAKNWSE